jgi:hypothetical protein
MIRSALARAARKRYRQIAPVLNEQSRRRFAALEARALGRGGVSLMARITGLARSTIYHGLSDIRNNVAVTQGRIRRSGGGRKKKASTDPTLLRDLKALVEPTTRGDPMHLYLWTGPKGQLRLYGGSESNAGMAAMPHLLYRRQLPKFLRRKNYLRLAAAGLFCAWYPVGRRPRQLFKCECEERDS